MLTSIKHSKLVDSFWELTGITKLSENYKVDQDLRSLEYMSLDQLRKVFVQYRFFTQYYIADLALLIGKMPFGKLRSILSEILYEELGNGNSAHAHPELYDQFLRSIGISDNLLEKADIKCIKNLEDIQKSLLDHSWAFGVGLRGMGGECLCQIYLSTMHHYFSKNSAILEMKDQVAWKFWDIHIGEVDLHHQTIVREAINEMVISNPTLISELTKGYLESKQAWDQFWKQIFKSVWEVVDEIAV